MITHNFLYSHQKKFGGFSILLLNLILTLFLYRFGWSGGWHFDDEANLGKLQSVFSEGHINASEALDFIFSGDAGPLGRSIALASFLIDGSGWPYDTRAMLYTNSLLHAVNGLLLAGTLLRLGQLHGWKSHRTTWVATISAALWVLLPISASASLMAVQRMTVLSSSFMLAGLWTYLIGRCQLTRRPWFGMLWMALGLGLGTLLGVFTKEQAALLPTFILVLEWTWLPAPQLSTTKTQRAWLAFRIIGLYLPTALIVGYLLRATLHAENIYLGRNFSLEERLWTQAVILWDYLRQGFLPRASALGPFHDDYPVWSACLESILAVLGWLTALLIAWLLRHKTKLPLLALLWFWAGHLIESTTLPLELYFEHRNYLALVGPLFALVAGIWIWAENHRRQRLVSVLLCLYGLLLAGTLWQITTLFGQPLVAAPIWYEAHPQSGRAAQYLAQQQVSMNALDKALDTLDAAAILHLNSGALRLQGLQLACLTGEPPNALDKRLTQTLHELPLAPRRFAIVSTLDKLKAIEQSNDCQGVLNKDVIASIALAALRNPHISASPQERSNLNVFLASLYMEERDLERTMQHMEAALTALPNLQNLYLATAILQSAGLYQEALNILREYPPKYPRNPWLQKRMHQEWQELHANLSQQVLQQPQNN